MTMRSRCWYWLALTAGGLLCALPALAAGEGEAASPTQLGRWYNALWAVGLFAVLLALLGRFAWKPVMKAIQDREDAIAATLTEARRRQEDSQALLARYKARLDAAQGEAEALLEQARNRALSSSEEMLKQARQAAAVAADQAQRDIELAKRNALGEIYEVTAQLATDVAARIIQKELRPEDHRRLVEESLEKLKES